MPCVAHGIACGSIAGSNPMFGLITRRHLVMHPVTVCRDYGWRVLVAGLLIHRGTFLELVARHAPHPTQGGGGPAPGHRPE